MNTTTRIIIAALFVTMGASTLPYLLFAQVSEGTQLREQIKTALSQDPRSQALSAEEFDQMVEKLAGEVEAQGAVEDFVVPEVFYEQVVPYPEPAPWYLTYGLSGAALFAIVLLSLGFALLALRHLNDRHQAMRHAGTPVNGA